MAAGLHNVLKHLRKVAAAENAGQLSDRQLVEHFVAVGDEAAFAALVHRHGAMVRNVCWRVLHNDCDADDACQATFLVLARKASSIRKKDAVASWLHGVADRAARNLRKAILRRLAREGQAAANKSCPQSEVTWREVQTILDEEIQRLSEDLKGPVLLCYLEGKTHNEGAQQLGWSLTTFRGRLERAREVLRKRLTQRGVTLSGALLASVLSEQAASAAASGSLFAVLVKGALASTPTKGVVSALVFSLAQGVMQTMFWNKLKIGVVAGWLTVIVVGISGLALHGLAGGGPTQTLSAEVQDEDRPNLSKTPVQPAAKTDKEILQGTWTLVETYKHGKKVDAKEIPIEPHQLVVAGDKIALHLKNGGIAKGTFALDATKKPKEITIQWFPPRWSAIYKMEGDTLTICFNENLIRPDEFRTLADSERALLVYKRAKLQMPKKEVESKDPIKEKKVLTPEQIFRDQVEGPVRIEFTVKAVTIGGSPFVLEEATGRPAVVTKDGKEVRRLQVTVTEKVESRLNQLGIEDLRTHFYGKTVRVFGNLKRVVQEGGGTLVSYQLSLENLEQLESVSKK